MQRSFQSTSMFPPLRIAPAFRVPRLLLLSVIICSLLPTFALAAPPDGSPSSDAWSIAETTHFRIHVQNKDPVAAAAFTARHGGNLETALRELRLLFATDPPDKRIDLYVYSDEDEFATAVLASGRSEIPGVSTFADSESRDILLFAPALDRMSPIEAENQLRHALAHIVTALASGGNVPWGFAEGIAQYIERPVNEKLARNASLVHASNQRGALPSWFDMNRPNAFVDPSLAAAQSYAVIAFLIDRYEIAPLREFMTELQTSETWTDAMRAAYGRDPRDLESQWQADVPRWTSGQWRHNLVAAFDLVPGELLLSQANYVAAKETLDPSQTLFRQINAPDELALVRSLIAQCDIGIQAESLMSQAEQALALHTYDRAMNLIEQAKLQFAQLPEEQQPVDLIQTYEQLAADGASAAVRLDQAILLSRSWRRYPEARDAALGAGTLYAQIGDQQGMERAQTVLSDLDDRQRRIVLMLAALSVITLVWLMLWLWARGPSEQRWR